MKAETIIVPYGLETPIKNKLLGRKNHYRYRYRVQGDSATYGGENRNSFDSDPDSDRDSDRDSEV